MSDVLAILLGAIVVVLAGHAVPLSHNRSTTLNDEVGVLTTDAGIVAPHL